MSALRISRPGYPTELVILEPAVGRISHARAAIHGSLVEARQVKRGEGPFLPATTKKRREQMAEYRRAHGPALTIRRELAGDARPNTPKCGATMKLTGEPCARRAGHADSHRSRYVMDNDAAMRRGKQAAGR